MTAKYSLITFLLTGLLLTVACSHQNAPVSSRHIEGRVRAVQVVCPSSLATWPVFTRTLTFVGMDLNDGAFVQLDIVGADMRFAEGLYLKVNLHRASIDGTGGMSDVIDGVECPSCTVDHVHQ